MNQERNTAQYYPDIQ